MQIKSNHYPPIVEISKKNVSPYRKQVKILEDIIDRFEQKMQLNFDNLEADYEAKLQKLKVEMTEMEKSHKEEKEELKVNICFDINKI